MNQQESQLDVYYPNTRDGIKSRYRPVQPSAVNRFLPNKQCVCSQLLCIVKIVSENIWTHYCFT